MSALVLAQTVCNLPQCTVCRDIDPDSWWWIFSGCWLIGSDAFAAGLALTASLLIASGYRALVQGR